MFTNLLAHCDQFGVVDIHPKAIAEEVGIPIERVKATISMLQSPDPESRTPDEGGRRLLPLDEHRDWGWRVVNYVKYRSIKNEDDRREQNRIAQEKWRNKNKHDVSKVSINKPSVSAVSRDKPMQKQKEKEIQIQNTKQPTTNTVAASGFFLPEWVNAEHWETWHSCPKRKKATDKQKQMAVDKLDQWRLAGENHAGALENAAMSGYQGLFLPTVNPARAGTETNYARSMREKMEVVAPMVAAKKPGEVSANAFFDVPATKLEISRA